MQTIFRFVLPYAFPGIVTGVIIGLAQAMENLHHSLSLAWLFPHSMYVQQGFYALMMRALLCQRPSLSAENGWGAVDDLSFLSYHYRAVVDRSIYERFSLYRSRAVAPFPPRIRTLMTQTTDIKCENVNVLYGENHALKNIDMAIKPVPSPPLLGLGLCKSTFHAKLNRMNDLIDNARVTGSI